MKIAITGSHGFIGGALVQRLRSEPVKILRVVRGAPQDPDEVFWLPGRSADSLDGVQAVVHLAGARIDRRWTRRVRGEIVHSRVDFTRALARELSRLKSPPAVWLCASAIGYYGSTTSRVDERSPGGTTWLARLTREWEAAAAPAVDAGIRVVHLRLGVVLAAHGGALRRMLPAFRLGLGGSFGDGRQWMSWIHLADAVEAIVHLLRTVEARGPYNLTAPRPVTNAEFASTLGRLLHRPARLRIPGWALRALFGEMASEVLLSGAPVLPARLLDSGFVFRFSHLSDALADLLGRPGRSPDDPTPDVSVATSQRDG